MINLKSKARVVFYLSDERISHAANPNGKAKKYRKTDPVSDRVFRHFCNNDEGIELQINRFSSSFGFRSEYSKRMFKNYYFSF